MGAGNVLALIDNDIDRPPRRSPRRCVAQDHILDAGRADHPTVGHGQNGLLRGPLELRDPVGPVRLSVPPRSWVHAVFSQEPLRRSMKSYCSFARLSGSLVLAAILMHGAARADEEVETDAKGVLPPISSLDCYSEGEEVATQRGGTLARSTSSTQDGREMCIVVVLIPASDGQRPQRLEILVPLDGTLSVPPIK